MPGQPDKEKILHEPELATLSDAGLVTPLERFRLIVTLEDGRKVEEPYDMVYVRGHGIGLLSHQSGKTYVLTLYGLRCLAGGLKVNQGDIIVPGSASAAHLGSVARDVARLHGIGEVRRG